MILRGFSKLDSLDACEACQCWWGPSSTCEQRDNCRTLSYLSRVIWNKQCELKPVRTPGSTNQHTYLAFMPPPPLPQRLRTGTSPDLLKGSNTVVVSVSNTVLPPHAVLAHFREEGIDDFEDEYQSAEAEPG